MARSPEHDGEDEADALESHLSGEALAAPESWDALTDWITDRTDFLPLLGWDKSFIRLIARMELDNRKGYLQDLPQQILNSQEYDEWRQLVGEYREMGERMIAFWKMRRGH